MVMPMGSSVPPTLYEDLQKNFKKLMFVYNVYGMTGTYVIFNLIKCAWCSKNPEIKPQHDFAEISAALTNSMDVKCLGHVAEGAVVKIVDPDSGNICGPNEVHMYAFF